MKALLLIALTQLISCASTSPTAPSFADDVKTVQVEMIPFSPARKVGGTEAKQMFDLSVSDEVGLTQSELNGECIYLTKQRVKLPLGFSVGDEIIEDPALVSVLCKHAWLNYPATESPDHDDEGGVGMMAPLNFQCEKIAELNRPLSYECELMQLKPAAGP